MSVPNTQPPDTRQTDRHAGQTTELEHPVVFYDGECGLCHRFVQFVLRRDHRRIFRFAPLQGETAAARLPKLPDERAEWSVVLLDQRGIHQRSDATLRALAHLGGFWKLAGVLLWLPRFTRDAGYRFVARRRYRWFGKYDACRVPTASEKSQLLP